jgi:tetratricopeptide (TPR) repeat protein
LLLTDAPSIDDVVHSDVVPAAYPPMQAGDDAPRVRLAQAQPMPLPGDGPDLEPPRQSAVSPTDNQTGIAPLPPIASPIASPIAPPIAPPIASPIASPIATSIAPPNFGPLPRSAELDAVARQADAHTARGFELAQRGAIYSARAEFIAALHTIAGALDAASAGNSHDEMLEEGLQALDEADDFAANGATSQSDADVSRIVAGHQTPVLKDSPLSGLSCTAALSRYLTFAQEQLAGCTAGVPAGSAALYGLGKVYCVPESRHGPADPTQGAKAVALHQAALLVDIRNYRSANELGVLLARFGRLPEARTALLHSIAVSPQPTTWQNLAAVHQQLGERDLATRAYHESVLAAPRLNRTGAAGRSAYVVQWLDPATFATTTPVNIDGTPPAQSNQQNNVAAGTNAAAKR